jgi:type VI secretion system protein ImpH
MVRHSMLVCSCCSNRQLDFRFFRPCAISNAAIPSKCESDLLRVRLKKPFGFDNRLIWPLPRQPLIRRTRRKRFFGLLGPAGPLPIHLTEIVRNRARHASDDALQAFLDIFHHRMASLFYRAWSSARPAIQRDRPLQDRFAAYLGSFIGHGTRHSQHRDAWSDDSKKYFAGQLASLHRNAEALEALIESILQVPVRVQPFALRWLPLSRRDRTKLDSSRSFNRSNQSSNQLGRTAVLGERIADRQGMVDVSLGPMSFSSFEQLMPDSKTRSELKAVVRTHSGTTLDARFRPLLRKEDVTRPQLGILGSLGRNTWIQSRPLDSDRSDFIFDTRTSTPYRPSDSKRTNAS